MLLIGITGTLGAGKGSVVEYLVREKGFVHYSVRAFLSDRIRSLGVPVNRDSLFAMGNDLRRKYGPSYIVDQLFLQAHHAGRNSIIESIRTTGEIASLRNKGKFHLFAVDADPKIRYERIRKRNSETDLVSFETFIQNEERESFSSDPGIQNLQACIRQADIVLLNNGTVGDLYKELDTVLHTLSRENR